MVVGLFTNEASAQLAVVGETRLVDGKASPRPYQRAAQPGSIVASVEVMQPGASFIKLLITDFELADDDYIIVRNEAADELRMYDARSASRFWTGSIQGGKAIIDLVSRSNEGGNGFRVQGVALGTSTLPCDLVEPDIQTCSLNCNSCACGPCLDCCGCDGEELCGFDYACIAPTRWQRREARPVCAIVYPEEPPGDVLMCSGYQIDFDSSNGWVLTAAHCVPDTDDWTDAEVWFNVERSSCSSELMNTYSKYTVEWLCGEDPAYTFDCDEPTSWGLDYALLQTTPLSGAASPSHWGKSRLSGVAPRIDDTVERFHHSNGCQKQFSAGVITNDWSEITCFVESGYRYVYTACGAGGSSGSPVYGDDHCVVLHHVFAGIMSETGVTPGSGVRMDLIIDDMETQECLPSGVIICNPGTGTTP